MATSTRQTTMESVVAATAVAGTQDATYLEHQVSFFYLFFISTNDYLMIYLLYLQQYEKGPNDIYRHLGPRYISFFFVSFSSLTKSVAGESDATARDLKFLQQLPFELEGGGGIVLYIIIVTIIYITCAFDRLQMKGSGISYCKGGNLLL